MDSYLYVNREILVKVDDLPVLHGMKMKWNENIWKDIVDKNDIPSNKKLYLEMKKRSKNIKVNPRSVFLDTWEIDENKSYHSILLNRGSENMTYGTFRLYEWFAFFCAICKKERKTCPIELQYIAGIVSNIKGVLFKIKKADGSVIEDLKGFYNLPNIIESLMNICLLRFSLNKHIIKINHEEISLTEILDEMALKVCVSPKLITYEIRKAVVFFVRHAGIESDDIYTLEHLKHISDNFNKYRAGKCVLKKVEKDIFEKFRKAEIYIKNKQSSIDKLKKYGLNKLLNLCEKLLQLSLNPKRTQEDDFVLCSSFLLSILMIGGYGRALNYSSSPRSKEESEIDKHGIGKRLKETVINFHNHAKENGHNVVTPENWKSKCMGYWKSTSAGVASEKVEIIYKGEIKEERVRKKMAIGVYFGNKLFSREMISRINGKENPSNVGYRDVPCRATRAIYVLPLPKLHAHIANVSHMVEYAADKGKLKAKPGNDFDASHISSGPYETSGIRIFDNMDVIKASGDINSFYLGLDLSSFDSSCVGWNFRQPIMEALKLIGSELKYKYGKDDITYNEMVEYSYGKGYLFGSWWDNGREPIIILKEDVKINNLIGKYIKVERIGKRIEGLRPLPGCSILKEEEEYRILDIDSLLEKEIEIPWDDLEVCCRMDGADLVYLTSEASGELSTLLFNSLENLSMQSILYEKLKETKFGKRFILKEMKAVGDDSQWIGNLNSEIEDEFEIDDFCIWIKEIYKEMGHEVRDENLVILPLGAEYVQTFARFGFYLPRDLIMLISSEKPRNILDPHGFVSSMQNLLREKVSRGMNIFFAKVVYCWSFLKLMKSDLRRHKIKINEEIQIKQNFESMSHIYVKDISVEKNVKEFKIEEVIVFRLSCVLLFFPRCANGGMWNPVCFLLTNTPPLFFYSLSRFNLTMEDKEKLLVLYAYAKERKLILDMNESEEIKDISLKDYKLSVEEVFSNSVKDKLIKLDTVINLGRIDGFNVPRRMMSEGLKMEPCMNKYYSYEREEHTERMLKKLRTPINKIAKEEEEWVLNFKIILDEKEELAQGHEFYQGLGDECMILKEIIGFSTHSNRIGIGLEKLRLIISKDPALKGIVSPAEVINVLDKFNINDMSKSFEGYILLAKMGFEEGIISEILNFRFSTDGIVTAPNTYGALCDSFSSSLNLLTEEKMSKFNFQVEMDRNNKVLLLLHSSLVYIFEIIYQAKNLTLKGVENIKEDDGKMFDKRWVLFPNLFIYAKKRNLNIINFNLSILRDSEMFKRLRSERNEDIFKQERRAIIMPPGSGRSTISSILSELGDLDCDIMLTEEEQKKIRLKNKTEEELEYKSKKYFLVPSISIAKLMNMKIIYAVIPDEKVLKSNINSFKNPEKRGREAFYVSERLICLEECEKNHVRKIVFKSRKELLIIIKKLLKKEF